MATEVCGHKGINEREKCKEFSQFNVLQGYKV